MGHLTSRRPARCRAASCRRARWSRTLRRAAGPAQFALTLFVLGGLLGWGSGSVGPAAAAGNVVAELSPRALQVGDRARLTITVEEAADVDAPPAIPNIQGLRIRSGGQQTNISIVNGAMSRSITFEYIVTALKEGDFVIPPIDVEVGGDVRRSQPLQFKVVAAGTPPPGSSGQVPDDSRPEAAEDGQVFVRAIVDRGSAYVGQQITLRFQFFQASGFTVLDSRLESPPETPGFWREEMPPQRTFSQVVDGRPYRVTEILYALFPTQTGTLEIGPGVVECVVRDQRRSRNRRDPFSLFGSLFEERRIRLRSRPVSVTVRALPKPEPEDFTGGVGTYRLRAELDRTEIPQNESTTLTLTVEGSGNVSAVGEPSLEHLRDFRAYSPISEVTAETKDDKVGGRKEFSIVLVPETAGDRVLPPVELSYFDPLKKRYRRLQTDSLRVKVLPAVGGSPAAGGDVSRVGWDLREIRAESEWSSIGDRIWRRFGFWAVQGVPLLLLAGSLFLRRRRDHEANNAEQLRARRAPKRFLEEIQSLGHRGGDSEVLSPSKGFEQLQTALERCLSHRFHFSVVGRSRRDLESHLRSVGMKVEAWERLAALLERCDYARFASQTVSDVDLQEALTSAERVAGDLEAIDPPPPPGRRQRQLGIRLGATIWLLAALGGPLSHGLFGAGPARAAEADEAADGAFQAANAAYAEGNYADAIKGYRRILDTGLESPSLYLNLGNAYYRDGQFGWAVHTFETGRRMSPRDPDLLANLRLAQRSAGSDPGSADSHPVLRWLSDLQDRLPLDRSIWLLTALVWGFCAWWAVRILRPRPGVGLQTLGGALAFVLVLAAGWTAVQALQVSQRPDQVVVAAELPVHANPSSEATVEFTLQQGALLRSYRTEPGFVEVRLGDELRGWAPREGLAGL